MKSTMRVHASLAALAAGLFLSSLAAAEGQEPAVAQIKTVSGQASVLREGNRMAAKVGDPLYEKDTIATGADGAIGLTFSDNTVLSAGPNSEIALQQYKFDSSNFTGSMLTRLRRGTVAMVSGDIARSSPDAMKVQTETATLAVRGTRFVVQAGE
jgi:hypothetical protein